MVTLSTCQVSTHFFEVVDPVDMTTNQSIGVSLCIVWLNLQSVQKMKKKKKNKNAGNLNQTLSTCISEMTGAISFKFGFKFTWQPCSIIDFKQIRDLGAKIPFFFFLSCQCGLPDMTHCAWQDTLSTILYLDYIGTKVCITGKPFSIK